MKINSNVFQFLVFTKRDRPGVFIIIIIVLGIYGLPKLFPGKKSLSLQSGSSLKEIIDSINTAPNKNMNQNDEADYTYYAQPANSNNGSKGELFQFDPNSLSVEGWRKLGLGEKTSRTIEKYRSKGGRFYKPEDIKKIWGMPKGFYEKVKDYISIIPIQNDYSDKIENTVYTKPEKKNVIININEADTSVLIALPGIGSKLASRIVNFRDGLGGFYSVEQVKEVYGLQDSTFQKIKASLQLNGDVKKLNINTATKDELKLHPYIKWNLANAIVEYRNQHGSFKGLNDLKNIALIDETTFEKISHYLTI